LQRPSELPSQVTAQPGSDSHGVRYLHQMESCCKVPALLAEALRAAKPVYSPARLRQPWCAASPPDGKLLHGSGSAAEPGSDSLGMGHLYQMESCCTAPAPAQPGSDSRVGGYLHQMESCCKVPAFLAEAQGVQEEGAKFGILPAVDENVDAGVEHEEEVGAVGQDLAPAHVATRG
jgi:hypothetical protein